MGWGQERERIGDGRECERELGMEERESESRGCERESREGERVLDRERDSRWCKREWVREREGGWECVLKI